MIPRRHAGFTIVELLIVIVVIGILAAITIVAFNGVQGKANDTAVKSDLSSMAKRIEVFVASSDDPVYPLPPTSAMGIKITKKAYLTTRNNLYYCRNTGTNEFALSAQSSSGKTFKYTSSGGLSEHAGLLYGDTTCQLIGLTLWGGNGALGYDSGAAAGAGAWASWTN